MKVFEIRNRDSTLFAFEVRNVGRRRLTRLLRSMPGVTVTRSPLVFSYFREEVFCEFDFSGRHFKALEPFGDNSRYWIGPEPSAKEGSKEIVELRELFAEVTAWNVFSGSGSPWKGNSG